MLPKFAWVVGPLLLYGAVCALLALRGRAPSRMALNVHISLLLLAYLLGTAGLGIFWVANQQLPVFDWHYLFGYATLFLVGLHLVFNLPLVLRWLGRRGGKAQAPAVAGGPLVVGKIAALALMLGIAFYVGKRQAGADFPVLASAGAQDHPIARYHTFSSESRTSVFTRAPGVAWGDAPPPFKRYDQQPRVALSKGQPGAWSLGQMLAAPAPAASLALADLGRMLHLTSGVTQRRGGHALRASPSSGALFPSELYVVARRVDGLAAGLYHYDPERHQLSLLGKVPASVGAPAADGADAVVLVSAVFRRTGYKYHNRAFRYALADAGHLLENLRLAAHGSGLHPDMVPEFDDALAARALGIDGVEEGVLAVVPLRRPGTGAGAGPACAPCDPPQAFAPVRPAQGTPLGVTGIVYQATSLRLQPGGGSDLALPPPAPATAELFTTIVQRRSERRYAHAALTMAQLSGLLAGMQQPPMLFDGIEISLVINRVHGIAPGVYRYVPGHALRLVRPGHAAAAAQSAALSQDVIGDAAAVLILSAARDRVLAGGARGYRHAFLEAGMKGQRWLLGAVARGLAACPVGAFYDDEAAALIGVQASDHWVLHFAAVGVRAN
ncbi:SagB/ThcOx family dehydrogenase [Massilia sp. PAMC28688]|uniref:SagB/ThcOx family dehydrogenase n=1 Tax=Massilia sp. PAMC28688 TaxID=2861283 RepID=UPI001C628554|nr:SagB/ThcOx family dehydrogenase [Massilia sp. PAMC28688]QYF94577.1 SagB/ThcOx family dehydrogenase [Massilia sp. PAMC28688]